jgi:nicotinamidase/pyrazinamidase
MNTVFFDIDTQFDFVVPAGALYVPGAEKILPAVARLNRFAMQRGIQLVSTVDAHLEDDPEFSAWPPHCVAGTLGQRKPESTLVGQLVLNKRSVDCFTIPELPGLLEQWKAERCVVYGVAAEVCVKFALFGLLDAKRSVELVTDAVKGIQEAAVAQMTAEFTARGGKLTGVDAVCAS